MYKPLLYIFEKGTDNPSIVDPKEYFPNYILFENNFGLIQNEAKTILKYVDYIPSYTDIDSLYKDTQSTNLKIEANNSWRTFMIRVMGNDIEDHMKLCPTTSSLIKQCPEIVNALFAILEGNSKIDPHTGWYKGLYKYHLPLIVPNCGDCKIRVEDTWMDFQEGKSILFDDTYEHEVRNNCNEYRVILLCDIKRTDFNVFLRAVNESVLNIGHHLPEIKKLIQNAEIQTKITS